MLDLSKLILLTTVNTFKAENQIVTGSFVIGGSAPEMNTSGVILRTYTVTLPIVADYYDILFNGQMFDDYTSFPATFSTNKWAPPGQAGYMVLLNATGYTNYQMSFELYASISGNVLTITALSANQFLASSAVLTNTTMNYRIIPYSSTTQ